MGEEPCLSDLLHDDGTEFMFRLMSGLTGRGFNPDGGKAARQLWQRDRRRMIDISLLNQQVETYDIEIDWDEISSIAADCGLSIATEDVIPLPLFSFRRFVQTEFECSSDSRITFSHRSFNRGFAALMATYGTASYLPESSDDDLAMLWDRWSDVFGYGGNYELANFRFLVERQMDAYDRAEALLNHMEGDAACGDGRRRADRENLDAMLLHLLENYPVLVYVPVSKTGRTNLRFEVRRYETSASRNPINLEVQGANRTSGFVFSQFIRFCGVKRLEYRYQWLRDSAFLKIAFPEDCRSACAHTYGRATLGGDAEFSDGVLYTSFHDDRAGAERDDCFVCYVLPKFRAIIRFLVPGLLEVMFLTLIATANSRLPGGQGDPPVPLSLFLTVSMAQLGAVFVAQDIKESPYLTNALKVPRVLSLMSVLFHCSLMTILLVPPTGNDLSCDGPFVPQLWWISVTIMLLMMLWALCYAGWRFCDMRIMVLLRAMVWNMSSRSFSATDINEMIHPLRPSFPNRF